MTDIAAAPVAPAPITPPSLSRVDLRAAGVLAAVIVAGDLLIYGHVPGLGLFGFFCAAALGVLAVYRDRLGTREIALAGLAFVLAALPLVEAPSPWGAFTALVGLGILALVASGQFTSLVALPIDAIRFAVPAPFRLLADVLRVPGSIKPGGSTGSFLKSLVGWVVPAVLAAVFLMLLSAANPVIELGLRWISLDNLVGALDPLRVFLWCLVAVSVWPFLRPRLASWLPLSRLDQQVTPKADGALFGSKAILRSLVVFNILFAVQTVLDLTYLWGGTTLPDGMSYAHYAHRGAYPLIVTALLAAAFVLAAMRQGGAAEGSTLIRRLVYLWVAQNVMLVISSIFRLWLYVEVYSLTEMRIAAGIWMVLVAIGLVLICARIAQRRSNLWLVSMNLYALGFSIYASAWVDFSAVIARFNLEHSAQATEQGAPLDLYYLSQLGPTIIPAVDDHLAAGRSSEAEAAALLALRNDAAASYLSRPQDWRSWSFRDWRLAKYLGAAPQRIRESQAASPLR